MALDATRIVTAAMVEYFDGVMKPVLVNAKLSDAQIDELKSQQSKMFSALANAVVDEIVSNGETVVTDDVSSIIDAIKGGSPIPQDGGAGLQSTIVASLPSKVSGKIK